jgi:pilus assembly protein Flp/PilA
MQTHHFEAASVLEFVNTNSFEGQMMLSRFRQAVIKLLVAEDGPTAVEYAVMLAMIVVVCMGAIKTLGSDAKTTFTNVGNSISGS